MTLTEQLERSRRAFASSEALVCRAVRLTYAEFGDRVDGLSAAFWRLGLADGARVAIFETNCHRYVEAYYAASRSGSVLVPINYRLAAAEIREILAESRARGILVAPGFLPILEAIRADVPHLEQVI